MRKHQSVVAVEFFILGERYCIGMAFRYRKRERERKHVIPQRNTNHLYLTLTALLSSKDGSSNEDKIFTGHVFCSCFPLSFLVIYILLLLGPSLRSVLGYCSPV